jgi:hypothetical protein
LLDDINDVEAAIFDDVDSDQVDQDLANESININASIDLCIELGSRDLIDIDEDANIFLTIDFYDSFLVVDSYVNQNS